MGSISHVHGGHAAMSAINENGPDRAVAEAVQEISTEGKPVRVERFAPALGDADAAVQLLHGADGLHLQGEAYRDTARALARRGFLALLVHYFDSTGNVAAGPDHFHRWVQTVGAAIDHAAGHLGSGARVGLVGFSLGAYLALAVAAKDRRVGAVVESCGGLPNHLAAHVASLPPVLILHGAADPVISVEEAHKLERLLRKWAMPYEIRIFPDQGHGFRGAAAGEALHRTVAFLGRHLVGPAPARRDAGTPARPLGPPHNGEAAPGRTSRKGAEP